MLMHCESREMRVTSYKKQTIVINYQESAD